MSGNLQFVWDMLESEWWKRYFETEDRTQPGCSAAFGTDEFGSWAGSRMDSSPGSLPGSWTGLWAFPISGSFTGSWTGTWIGSSFSSEDWSGSMPESWWQSSSGSWWMNIPEEWWTSWNGSRRSSSTASAGFTFGPGYGLHLI